MAEIKVRPASSEEFEAVWWVRRQRHGRNPNYEKETEVLYTQMTEILNVGMGTAVLDFSEVAGVGVISNTINRLKRRASEDGIRLQTTEDGNRVMVRNMQLMQVGELECSKEF